MPIANNFLGFHGPVAIHRRLLSDKFAAFWRQSQPNRGASGQAYSITPNRISYFAAYLVNAIPRKRVAYPPRVDIARHGWMELFTTNCEKGALRATFALSE